MKTTKTNLPTPIIITGLILICALSFLLGTLLQSRFSPSVKISSNRSVDIKLTKTDKPQLDFFVMSFCPFGNQTETVLKPVFDLLKDKADITPHYIFEKSENLKATCQANRGNPDDCASYIQQGAPFNSVDECKTAVNKAVAECTNEKNYLKIGNDYYSSLHGRVEANQNIREICAWNQTPDKAKWWNFVLDVNAKCNDENADTCWENSAKSAGLDVSAITNCFNNDAKKIMDSELALTEKNQIYGSPSFLLNGQALPPLDVDTSTSDIKIGKQVFDQSEIRTPEFFKSALCASSNKSWGECKKILEAPKDSNNLPSDGGCH